MGIRLTDLPDFWLVLAGISLIYGLYTGFAGIKRSRGVYIPSPSEALYLWFARLRGRTASEQVKRKLAKHQKWNRVMATSAIITAIGSIIFAVVLAIFSFLISMK